MASRQEKLERAEAAARVAAASDLGDINREREDGQATGVCRVDADPQHEEERPGVIGSVLKAVTGTLGHAKEAVVSKSHEADAEERGGTESNAGYPMEKTKEAKDNTVGKAGEYKDYTADKTKEAKDKTLGKAGEYKDYTVEKAKEARDYTAEKAKEAKDKTGGKAEEYRDYAAEKARDYNSDVFARENPSEGERGIFSRVTEAVKSKLTHPTDDVDETGTAAREQGGIGRRDVAEKAEIKLEETRPGAVAATLKAADQMTGQTFNDVGRMDDEGIVRLDREDHPGN